ncbi:hypothetical protein TNCV_4451931 [Trichonephila clavipes]|nr:hypothetical protein TNCV_4451931 [Trichonephila clavipes]
MWLAHDVKDAFESSHHVIKRRVTHVFRTKNIFQLDSKSGLFPAPSQESFHQPSVIRLLPFLPCYMPQQVLGFPLLDILINKIGFIKKSSLEIYANFQSPKTPKNISGKFRKDSSQIHLRQ